MNTVEKFPSLAQIGTAEVIREQIEGGCLDERFVRHHEGAAAAHLPQAFRQSRQCAGTKDDRRRK